MDNSIKKQAKHLDLLRKEHNITEEDFCEGICIPRSYRRYLKNDRNFSYSTLIKFCDKLSISLNDFFYSLNTREKDEYFKVEVLYKYIMRREFQSFYKELKNIESDKLLSTQNIRFLNYCITYADYETHKTNKLNSLDRFANIIDYPKCISKNILDLIDVLCLQSIAEIEIKQSKNQALNKLFNILQDKTNIYISYDNKYIFPSIYANVSILLSRLYRYDEALILSAEGVDYCIKYNDINSLAHLRYIKAYCLLKQDKIDEAKIEASKCILAAITKGNNLELQNFIRVIEKDFQKNLNHLLNSSLKTFLG